MMGNWERGKRGRWGDKETRRQGDGETRRQGDKEIGKNKIFLTHYSLLITPNS